MDTLYHYTTIDALLNMVKTDSQLHFWATRYDYLNDGEELKKRNRSIKFNYPQNRKGIQHRRSKKNFRLYHRVRQ